MKELASEFRAYTWAPPNDEVARLAGIDPSQVIRFDQNTPPLPLPSTRPGTIARALSSISGYPPGGYHELKSAIAAYNGLGPENVVLGTGADDLILLVARSYAGPGDTIAIPEAPTYPLYRIAAQLARAEVGDDDPVLTFTCRPNNPMERCARFPEARPLVVDEAYFEYCGETAIPLLEDGVIVLRTFSKAFALAGARVGYALAAPAVAEELNARQAPAPVSTLSAALALAGLASPPELRPVIEERERFASALARDRATADSLVRQLSLRPGRGRATLGDRLLRQGFVVRAYADAIRLTVRDRVDDDLVVEALARILDRPSPVAEAAGRRARHLRATAETRISVRLGLDGASRVSVQTGGGLVRPLSRAARVSRRARPHRRGHGRPRDGRSPHRRRHGARVRRGPRSGPWRPPWDRALRGRGRADGRCARASRRRSRRPAVRRARDRAGARDGRPLLRQPRAGGPDGDPRRGHRPRCPPHRRGRIQGSRACAQDGASAWSRAGSRRRRGSCEGRRLRLPRGEHPLGRDRDAPARRRARRRRRGRRPRRAPGSRLGALGDGRAAPPGARRAFCARASRRAARCSGSASAFSSRSNTPRRTAASRASGSFPAARSGSPRRIPRMGCAPS